jgi:hypothetical protein
MHDNLRSVFVFCRGREGTAAWKGNDSLGHAIDTTSALAAEVIVQTDIFPS